MWCHCLTLCLFHIQLCCWQTAAWYTQTLSLTRSTPTPKPKLRASTQDPPCSSGCRVSDSFLEGESTWNRFISAAPWVLTWLTAAWCKSSAIIESYCCIHTSEMCRFFYVRPLAKDTFVMWVDRISHLILGTEETLFFTRINRVWGVWGFEQCWVGTCFSGPIKVWDIRLFSTYATVTLYI